MKVLPTGETPSEHVSDSHRVSSVSGLVHGFSTDDALALELLGVIRSSEDLEIVCVLELVTTLGTSAPSEPEDLVLGDVLEGIDVLYT